MSSTVTRLNADELARRFQRYAKAEYWGSSPLYEHLAQSIATDEEMLALAAHAPANQPIPNLFFAAVHFLLLQGQGKELAQFYPSLTPDAEDPATAYPTFRAFSLSHTDAIRHLLATRRNQTNEVRRCTYLVPAFSQVSMRAHARPLALIKIGTSAGLNLMWDQYSYRYGDAVIYGRSQSPVQLTCTWRGSARPPLPAQMPRVALKIGIDLHIVDVQESQEALWLRALVWPEQAERAQVLHHAMALMQASRPRLLSGDGVELLPDVIRSVPEELALCVFHTHVLNQFSRRDRDRLAAPLAACGKTCDLYRISVEWLGTTHPQLELTAWQNGQAYHQLLAYCDQHGEWLEWFDSGSQPDRFK